MMKMMIYIILAAIFIVLGLALFSLLKLKKEDKENKIDLARTAKLLKLRIGLSIFLFFLLIFSFLMGWIKPHGINPNPVLSQPINENKQK